MIFKTPFFYNDSDYIIIFYRCQLCEIVILSKKREEISEYFGAWYVFAVYISGKQYKKCRLTVC